MKEEDAALCRTARAELAADPRIPARSIRVDASDGVVEISGRVGDYAAKWRAERVLERVRGVRKVVNDIRVVPETLRSDEQTVRAATASLTAAGLGDRVTAVARAGWLVLEGQVRWDCERRAAAEAARSIPGICGLTNALTIRPHRRGTATRVRRDVEAALRRDAFVASNVAVSVSHGNVRLAGTVGTVAEAREAEARAWTAPGVGTVFSVLRVEPRATELGRG